MNIVFLQRNDPAAAYDAAMVALLEAQGWTVTVETTDLSGYDWGQYDLLIVGALGTEYVAPPNSAQLDGYAVDIVSLCRYTSRVSLGLSTGSGWNSETGFNRASGADLRAEFPAVTLATGGGSVSVHWLSSLTSGTALHYDRAGSAGRAGIAVRVNGSGYGRTHFGTHTLDVATDNVKTLLINYIQGREVLFSSPVGDVSLFSLVSPQVLASLSSPIGSVSGYAQNDWASAINPITTSTYYAMEIQTSPAFRVPISSWQATVQTGRASYLQCVVPAAGQYAEAIIAASEAGAEMVIYRGALFETLGMSLETELARAPIQTPRYDRGPTNSTMTLSGYAQLTEGGMGSRTLQGVRSVSSSPSIRVRSEVDWFLRPGQTVTVGEVEFVAGYINYIVGSDDQYMDVGESSGG